MDVIDVLLHVATSRVMSRRARLTVNKQVAPGFWRDGSWSSLTSLCWVMGIAALSHSALLEFFREPARSRPWANSDRPGIMPPCATGGSTRTRRTATRRSEEHTSELQSLMRISYAVFCLKKKKSHTIQQK